MNSIKGYVATVLKYEDEYEDWKVVLREHVEEKRWTQVYRAVILDTNRDPSGRHFEFFYEEPSTEMVAESPEFENDEDVPVYKVFKKEKVVIVYER